MPMINFEDDLEVWEAVYKSITTPFGNDCQAAMINKKKLFAFLPNMDDNLEVTITPTITKGFEREFYYQRMQKLTSGGAALKESLFQHPTIENYRLYNFYKHRGEMLKSCLQSQTTFNKEAFEMLPKRIKNLFSHDKAYNSRRPKRRCSNPIIFNDFWNLYIKNKPLKHRRCRSCICNDCGGQHYNKAVQMKMLFYPIKRKREKAIIIKNVNELQTCQTVVRKKWTFFPMNFSSPQARVYNKKQSSLSNFSKALSPVTESRHSKCDSKHKSRMIKKKLPPIKNTIRYEAIGDIASRRFYMYNNKAPPNLVRVRIKQ